MGQRSPFRFPIRQAAATADSGVSVTDVAPITTASGRSLEDMTMSQAVTQTTTGAAGNGQRPRADRLMAAPTIQDNDDRSLTGRSRRGRVGARAAPDARAYYARESLDGADAADARPAPVPAATGSALPRWWLVLCGEVRWS